MKVKRRTICQTCRKRKISCDGKKPGCSQCVFRDLRCPGYESEWTFVPHNADHNGPKTDAPALHERALRPGSMAVMRRNRGGALATIPRSPANALAMPLDHLIMLIVRAYAPEHRMERALSHGGFDEPDPRFCGAWVESLPDLVAHGGSPALNSAINAFALSILCVGPRRSAPVSKGREAYSLALRSLRTELQSATASMTIPDQLAATIMCLLMAEFILPTSLLSWTAHLNGFGQLIQSTRPELYVSGIAYKIFVGARPALIALGFIIRKASFLATDKWLRIPFRQIPPSPVQRLMTEAAGIPPILERLDITEATSREAAVVAVRKALPEFVARLDALERWERQYQTTSHSPRFWTVPASVGKRPHIWFQNISSANSLTHLWAFKTICLASIDNLASSYPEVDFDRRPLKDRTPTGIIFRGNLERSIWICQSVEYLLQDELRLFGPTSIALPLRTAYDIFEAGGSETKDELDWCVGIVADLARRGFRWVPLFFERFQSQITDTNDEF
ncbi:hypothetical protein B0T25DRAFT_526323 [Lasiosphaeria hispida]|uniref:Zn(2)-C6 fungal-type domain-containing protein n=1 Tax=Lasiosphaeria hispida TaxID=260671 RepID=A0AAJ0HUS4_9PEZI|nr:hypothetical protein B0T25DRAFT_526323 [Lasiosphaeria hispida]